MTHPTPTTTPTAAPAAGGTMQETQVQDWRTLPAGRELDALVAERVMGYVWRRAPRNDRALMGLLPPDEAEGWPELRGDELRATDYARFCANFSTDIAAAWQVVEALWERGIETSAFRHAGGTEVHLWIKGTTRRAGRAAEDTAPLAICRAALAAGEVAP